MSEPFLAELRMVGFNFAPRGWAFCDGQILPINQNQSLYSLLGTTYGGDGRTTFALPELRGRTPIGVEGSNHRQGQKAGEETHSLSIAEIPSHTHTAKAANADAVDDVPDGFILNRPGANVFAAFNSAKAMGPAMISNTGNSAGHNNMQPYLAVNFCIAIMGLFPSRN